MNVIDSKSSERDWREKPIPAFSHPASAAPILRIEKASKRFGSFAAVDAVDLAVSEGEFLCLLGPSGCGKTTLLRMLAGFERPDSGRILLDGADVSQIPPHRRPVNMMFQSYALFPHMNVARNIGFGLRQEGLPKSEIESRVEEMLALTRLEGLGGRRPDQLSGGQRQRVALARALAKRPRLLLLDEPMAALDRKLREETQIELKALQARLGLTFITVTHDQTEAMTMADRIAVMDAGRLAQVGRPRDIYERPSTLSVARFIGDATLFEGETRDGENGALMFVCAKPDIAFAVKSGARGATHALARPENIRLYPWRPSEQPNVVQGTVIQSIYRGDQRLVLVDCGGVVTRVSQSNAVGGDNELEAGASVFLSIAPEALILLER
ncbi:ABC transporter ATP-binding protein [Terrarubrum flagellatum]|uniref:ABC transporter ATP-binding protein n=1 Tax=Terrirubrum flagellatum TaxID=2895980 RepID=UPI0031455538